MIVQSSQVVLAEMIEAEAVEVAGSREAVEVIVTIDETVIVTETVVVEIGAEAERGADLATGDFKNLNRFQLFLGAEDRFHLDLVKRRNRLFQLSSRDPLLCHPDPQPYPTFHRRWITFSVPTFS